MAEVTRKKIIIDCDPGTDDAQAIMMALADKNVEVVAITTMFGNAHVEDTARNALRLLKFLNHQDIAVYKGCSSSLTFGWSRTNTSPYHGHVGMGDVLIDDVDPVDSSSLSPEHASVAMCRLAAAYPGHITLVAIGPLTNIAVALMLDPSLGEKLKECIIMGGNYLGRGNTGTNAEYNWFCDPEAAHNVISCLKTHVTIVPLETCEEASFDWAWYKAMTGLPYKSAQLIKRIDEHSVGILNRNRKDKYMTWDQLAMAIVIDSRVAIDVKQVHARVELHGKLTRGQMVIDSNTSEEHKANVNIVTKVDFGLYEKLISTAFHLT